MIEKSDEVWGGDDLATQECMGKIGDPKHQHREEARSV